MKTIISIILLSLALVACSETQQAPETTMSTSSETTAPSSTTSMTDMTEAPETPAAVTVQQFRFQPEDITVVVGTTVTWSNEDRILHTVTAGAPDAPTGEFDEEMPDQGTTVQVTFSTAGTFDYFCSRHPHMVGTVTVMDGS